MGMFYMVDPFTADDREYLESEGVEMPRRAKPARNPTPAEIRQVCDALDGFDVKYNASKKGKYWQAAIEGKGKNRNKGTLLNIEKWGGSEDRRYKIIFEKGDPALILQICHALSSVCGPLVVFPDSDVPLVVWPEADLKKLRRQWGITSSR